MLLFYPGDQTPVCTKQFCSYRDRAADVAALDATWSGISSQGSTATQRSRQYYGLTVPLLADEDSAVAKAYGVRRAPVLGTQRRAVVIVDEDGRIAPTTSTASGSTIVGRRTTLAPRWTGCLAAPAA